MAALLLAFAAPLFAGEMAHGACATKQHDCAKTARLTQCCCNHASDHGNDEGTVPAPRTIAPAALFVPIVPAIDAPATAPVAAAAIQTSPPRLADLSLQVLFVTFLI